MEIFGWPSLPCTVGMQCDGYRAGSLNVAAGRPPEGRGQGTLWPQETWERQMLPASQGKVFKSFVLYRPKWMQSLDNVGGRARIKKLSFLTPGQTSLVCSFSNKPMTMQVCKTGWQTPTLDIGIKGGPECISFHQLCASCVLGYTLIAFLVTEARLIGP